VQKPHICTNFDRAELLQPRLALLKRWEGVVEVSGVAESIRPEGRADGLGPSLARVEELLPCALREVSDSSLGDPILEMGVDTAEGKFLLLLLAILAKKGVREAPIVAMVVINANAMLGGEAFKGAFRQDGFPRGKIAGHEIDELEAGEVIDENGGIAVARLGESPFCLRVKTRLRRLHVVDGDTLPRLGRGKNGVTVFTALFGAPRDFCHRAIEAAGTSWGTDFGQLLRDLAISRELLEPTEGEMAEAVVPTHELGLIVGSGERILVVVVEDRRRVEG
jgi:hypothetical protein